MFAPNAFVREVLEVGHTLPFNRELGPPIFRGIFATPLRGGPERQDVLLSEIGELVEKRAVEAVPPGEEKAGWYGTYFLVPKKTGGWRPILNLRPLNQLLVVEKFKMETLRNIVLAVREGEWMASLDLKDAYFHVPIIPQHRKFLRFCVQGRCYQYRVLPFGLSTSPRIFTKVLAPVMAALRLRGFHVHPYLDDILVRAGSQELLKEALEVAQSFLELAGFIVNLPKSHLAPTQDLVFVGARFRTDVGMVFLPDECADVIARLVRSFPAGVYQSDELWLRLLGLMAATIQVVSEARLRMRPIQL